MPMSTMTQELTDRELHGRAVCEAQGINIATAIFDLAFLLNLSEASAERYLYRLAHEWNRTEGASEFDSEFALVGLGVKH